MPHTARLIQLRKEFAEGLMFKLIHVNLFHKLQSLCSFSYRDIIQIFICLSRERKREFKKTVTNEHCISDTSLYHY